MKKTRVLIADDSPTAVDILESIFRADPEIEVVGRAANGLEVIRLAESLKPDVITMDIQMPVMNGLDAIRHIMAYRPTPILVVTSHTDSNTAFQSLSIGALDVMEKPKLELRDLEKHEELLRKVKLLAHVKVITHMSGRTAHRARAVTGRTFQRIVGIVASTGGPRALAHILAEMPDTIEAPILIVQHIADGFADGLVEWLNDVSSLLVKRAEHGEKLQAGTVYVARTGRHLEIDRQYRIVLSDRDPYLGQKPSGNLLLHSLAQCAGRNAIGLVMTGMGSDGAEGLKALSRIGAPTLVQDESTSLIYGMPKAAVDLEAAGRILPLNQLADEIGMLCRHETQPG